MAGAMYGKIGPDMGMGGEESEDPMLAQSEESDDPVMALARKAFPDSDWTPERVSALEELISHCSGMGGDYEPPSERGGGMGGGDKGKKAALILALGPPKKK